MKIVVAPDSFKGSLKSPAVARAMAAGARAAVPGAETVELPVGDGGEGTLEALVQATGGAFETHTVTGPLGEPVAARLGLLGDGETVFVEMAEASGLSRVPPDSRDPLRATSFGTGELLRAALQTGRPRLVVGIGGSATNDGGAGLLRALGVAFRSASGDDLAHGGAALLGLESIDLPDGIIPPGIEIVVACDVTNPLTGPEGASAVYGPQKGASPEDIRLLDRALGHYAAVAGKKLGRNCMDVPGAGAAGGLGFALVAFLGARLERGAPLVLDAVRFDEHLRGASLVLTGEGRIDRQTTEFGKTLTAIGERARRGGVPVLALAGGLGTDLGDYRAAGISAVGSIVPRPMELEEAMKQAPTLLEDAARRLVEVFHAGFSAAPQGLPRHGGTE
jgi:glycerate 2-kinase